MYDIVKALMNPEVYDEKVIKVKLIQTHISWIFLTGKYVYKIKKPVNFGFLDFTTLEKRKFFCDRELELNKRLCGDMYVEVVPITESNGKIRMKGKGKVIEYAVKMRELPQDAMMSRLLKRNINKKIIERIARIVANFHENAETNEKINCYGSLNTIKKNWKENFDQTKGFIRRTITKKQFDYIQKKINAFIEKNEKLFNTRVKKGKIRDCHGDLHSENIFITDGIYIFDCIEFNERFRYSDTTADVAFLAMDLDFHGRTDLSNYFIEKYVEYSNDRNMLKLMMFYKCYRAYVKGKVMSFRLDDPNIQKKEKNHSKQDAKKYFDLAYKYAERILIKPILIVMTGLIGSGKSFLAENLSMEILATVIKSDVVRKELAGIEPTTPIKVGYGKSIYSDEFTERVYTEMINRAEKSLRDGMTCILDATFFRKKYRDRARKLAQKLDSNFMIIECVCPENIIYKRLIERAKNVVISDGRWEIYKKQKLDFEPIQSSEHALKINTTKDVDECVNDVLAHVNSI